MRAFCGVSVSLDKNPASRIATLLSITRPFPERDACYYENARLGRTRQRLLLQGCGRSGGEAADTMPFAPAAITASTSTASAPL